MKKFYKMNQYITDPKLRVIGVDEKQIGILDRDEALFKAQKAGLDLIVVAQKANPPVARIIDFNKFKYQQSQKEKEGKKKSKAQGQKEVRFTPFIAQGDFATRIEKAKDFLLDGHKVKLTVKFTGRQITRKEFGEKLLKKASKSLSKISSQDSQPKLQGKLLWIILGPIPQKVKSHEKEKK